MNNSTAHRFKLLNPSRNQVEMQMKCLDDLLPFDHKARAVWEYVEKMDIDTCLRNIHSYRDSAGRPTTSPKVLLCLWIYSIMDGNISARKIEDLCLYHDAYKWIAGGTPINRTMLSDFRSKHSEKFHDLLISCLAVMLQSNLISDQDFNQDGTRVKANAGFSLFHREKTLEALKQEIAEHIKELEEELYTNPNAYDARTKAAKVRAARERSERINQALENLEESQKRKIESSKKTRQPLNEEELKETRASITDPMARKMKMGDGGFRLAYNVQFATGTNSRVIFGVDVVNTLDPGTSTSMMQQVQSVLQKLKMATIKNWCADAAYSGKEDVESVNYHFPECNYYAPAKPRKGVDPKKIQKNDSEAVKKWRASLDTEEMREIYKHRCSTAEFSNAQTKNHGFVEFLVRGIEKARGMAILHAIAHNISRYRDMLKKATTVI